MAGQIQRELQNGKPIASLEVEAFLNVQRTAEVLTQMLDGVLARAELRLDEYNVLRILRGAGPAGRMASDVRARMVRDTGRFQALIHGLRQRGLIDGALTHTITAAGLALLAETDGRVDRAIRQRMVGIEPGKLRVVVEVLEALRRA